MTTYLIGNTDDEGRLHVDRAAADGPDAALARWLGAENDNSPANYTPIWIVPLVVDDLDGLGADPISATAAPQYTVDAIGWYKG